MKHHYSSILDLNIHKLELRLNHLFESYSSFHTICMFKKIIYISAGRDDDNR